MQIRQPAQETRKYTKMKKQFYQNPTSFPVESTATVGGAKTVTYSSGSKHWPLVTKNIGHSVLLLLLQQMLPAQSRPDLISALPLALSPLLICLTLQACITNTISTSRAAKCWLYVLTCSLTFQKYMCPHAQLAMQPT